MGSKTPRELSHQAALRIIDQGHDVEIALEPHHINLRGLAIVYGPIKLKVSMEEYLRCHLQGDGPYYCPVGPGTLESGFK